MPFNPTVSQKNAIDTDGSVLVTAAAGSGKTAVLTERVIRKLTDENDYIRADELLIVTFTNAAAEEMRSRIEKKLFEKCRNNPNDKFLLEQKHLLQSASICTIDSFCINLVRENFEKCGVGPNFTVSDGSDMKSTCAEILENLLNEQLSKNSNEYAKLLEITTCEYDDSPLKKIIEDIYLYSMQMPFPDNFLDSLVLPYNMDFDKNHPWVKGLFEITKQYLNRMREHLINMGDTIPNLTKNGEKANDYCKTIAVMLDNINTALLSENYDKIKDAVYNTSIGTIPRFESGDVYGEIFKAEKGKLKNILDKVKNWYTLSSSENENQLISMKGAVELLISIIKEYGKRTFDAFCEENRLTFYHTEQLAFSLLCEIDDSGNLSIKEDAKSYIKKYKEVLVDEYQDVNDLQNMLFEVLSDFRKNLFVVGDVKQSIYRFRGSNPKNFLNKKNSYVDFQNAKSEDEKKIVLSDNFRSRKGVCDFVNFFFGLLMNENTGELIYNEEEYLNSAAEFPETNEVSTELIFVDGADLGGNNDIESSDEDSEKSTILSFEAKAVAKRIKELVDNKTQIKNTNSKDNGETRDCQYSDICILLEKVKGKADIYSKALLELGIPVSSSFDSFCDTIEISLALSLLTVIDNPLNDIALLSVMMSPIFGFTPEELSLMRAECKHGDIYKTVLLSASNGNEKAKRFLSTISDFRRECAILPLDRFLLKLLNDTNLFAIVSALDDGEQRRNNLMKLVTISRDMNGLDIGDFVKHIYNSTNISNGKDGNNRGVKIMTMHSSKGLQFPICIIADLASQMNASDTISRVLFSGDLGIAFKYFDKENKATAESIGRKLISKKALDEKANERMRLLYVAMTRAEEKLILVSSNKNGEKAVCAVAENINNGEINPEFIKSAKHINSWVIACCLLHKDGKILRNLADKSIGVKDSNCDMSVSYISKLENIKPKECNTKFEEIDESLLNDVKTACEYSYPFDELSDIMAKTSVSNISKEELHNEYLFRNKPAFMENKGISYADRGTATHKVMQFIKFSKDTDVDSEIERLYEYEYISELEKDCVETDKIKEFFSSNVYKRILISSMYKREMRFLTTLPASRVKEDINEKYASEPITVQGAVDLVFVEGDGIVILDFKTDRTNDESVFAKRYSEQLEIYSKACEEIFGKKVKERIIYSFYLSKEIPLSLESH